MYPRSLKPGLALSGLVLIPVLAFASLTFSPLATAGAIASATSTANLSVEEVIGGSLGTDVTATYAYEPTASFVDETSTGNAYASNTQTPDSTVTDNLDTIGIWENQQGFSEAGADNPSGSGFATLTGEGFLTLTNLTVNALDVLIGYDLFLSTVAEATPTRGFADAYARAMVAIFDDNFVVEISKEVVADFANGVADPEFSDNGSFLVSLGAGESVTLRIQTQTEAQAQFVPEPASLALMALGLVGAAVGRRRKTV